MKDAYTTRTRWLAAALAIVAVVGLAWWWLASRGDERPVAPAAANAGHAGMPGMGGMDMSGDGTVTLTAAQVQQFGITFGTVE